MKCLRGCYGPKNWKNLNIFIFEKKNPIPTKVITLIENLKMSPRYSMKSFQILTSCDFFLSCSLSHQICEELIMKYLCKFVNKILNFHKRNSALYT